MAISTTWTDPSESGTLDLTTGSTVTEAIWEAVMSNILRLGGSAGSLLTSNGGIVFVNDSANTKMTQGITINQGANDDEALAIKSSDIAHGVTTEAETDTYCTIKKLNAGSAGTAVITGFDNTAGTAMRVFGVAAATSATRTTSAPAPVCLSAAVKSGTAAADVGADKNLVTIDRYGSGTKFIFDSDGDSHQDVGTAWTNFDDHNDVALLDSLSLAVSRPGDPIRQAFVGYIEENRPLLERLKLVTFNEDGHHFVNYSGLTRLLVGAVRQLGRQKATLEDRLAALEERIMLTESRLAALPNGEG